MMKRSINFYQVKPEYCCIDLFRATESGYLDEVVSGIYFPSKERCKDGIPRVKFCPFCGAEIITKKTDTGWNWEATKNNKL